MNLAQLLLQTLLIMVPPGHTKFSVIPINCQDNCKGYKWSSFYNSFVRTETVDEGTARYLQISTQIIDVAKGKLCLDDNLNNIEGCTKAPNYKSWKFVDLVSVVSASMIAESGLREDIEVGRGKSGKPSDDGGQGRGPGNEVCLVQILPENLKKENIDPLSFLGPDALDKCFSFGMDMFTKARSTCAYRAKRTPEMHHDWVFETFSLYGTGNTCISANNGKTTYRRGLFSKISSDFGARVHKEQKKLKTTTLPLPPP